MTQTAGTMTAAGIGGAGKAGSRPKLERAYLQLFEPSKDASMHNPGPKLARIDFQFNPKELVIAKAASWSRKAGKGSAKSAPPQYQGPQPSKLALEMFLDSSQAQSGDVVAVVNKLLECCVPTSESQSQKKGSPPWVQFRWGSLTGFMGYVASVSAKYTLFTSGGLPVRAACTLSLEELAGDPPKQNPTSGGLLPREIHRVVVGDTLAGIAYQEYANAGKWRALAEANGIDNPMKLKPGSQIMLPAVEELGARSPAGHAWDSEASAESRKRAVHAAR